jgi:hypothetical protein
MASLSHIKVQRGSVSFGASAGSTAITITTVGSLSSAFARVTGIHHGAADPTAGGTSNKNNDDDGAHAVLTATTTVTITLPVGRTTEDRTVYWEVWEYTGPASGKYEFIVKDHAINVIGNGSTSHTTTTNVSGTKTHMAIVHCGQSNDSVGTQTYGNALAVLSLAGTSPNIHCTASRGGNAQALNIAYAIIEFTGSGWTISQLENATLSASAIGADVDVAISSVTAWANAMILHGGHSLQTATCTNADVGVTIRPGADVTHVKGRLSSAHSNPGGTLVVFTVYVIYGPLLSAVYYDSIAGGGTDFTGGGAAPQTVDVTITTLADTTHASVMAYADNDSSATSYPSSMWVYTLQDASTVRFFRARTVGGGDWAFGIYDFNAVGYVDFQLSDAITLTTTLAFQINPSLSIGLSLSKTLAFSTSFHLSRSVTITPTLRFVFNAPTMSRSITLTPTLALTHFAVGIAVRVTRITAEWAVRRFHQQLEPLT